MSRRREDSCDWRGGFSNNYLTIEAFFIMYYTFGFLFLVFIILLITCSEATVLLCYFHVCAETLSWKKKFLIKLSLFSFIAVYLFTYAVHYFFAKLQITGIASTILYFEYTMIMVLIFFLFTGNCGVVWYISDSLKSLGDSHNVKSIN
uniref:Transmembrane 9 superfamily member n=1 Tax=Prolemur simus TaxID=1328070 RepID=A0A8C8YD70_PROSS